MFLMEPAKNRLLLILIIVELVLVRMVLSMFKGNGTLEVIFILYGLMVLEEYITLCDNLMVLGMLD
jgi:hypothetical protein